MRRSRKLLIPAPTADRLPALTVPATLARIAAATLALIVVPTLAPIAAPTPTPAAVPTPASTAAPIPVAPAKSPMAQGQEELQALYSQARDAMMTADQPFEPVQLFSQLIALIEARAAAGPLPPEAEDLLARSYEGRALTHFSFAQQAEAEADLRRLIEVRPDWQVDRGITPSFVDLFDRLRADMVGTLEIDIDPPEVDLLIDERAVDPLQRRYSVLAGAHTIAASRPGHTSVSQEVEVEAGTVAPLQITLHRSSAVVKLMTRPQGAAVYLDGTLMGTTSGTAPPSYVPQGAAAAYPVREFSDELLIENLMPGSHQLRVEMEGYRTQVLEVPIEDIADYTLPPVLLEVAEGIVALDDLPAGATVTVDGQVVAPERGGSEPPRLRLAPGEHRVLVHHGTQGTFEANVSLADRQRLSLQVVLRPAVALLGVLGGDEIGAGSLAQTLRSGFASRDQFTLLDRVEEARPILEELGIGTDELRDMAESSRVEGGGIVWRRVQQMVDRQVSSSVYILVVLNDDLMATQADLWVWPAAPGPSTPDRLRVELANPSTTAAVLDSFSVSLLNSRPWLGALLVDSGAAGGTVVASVTAGGPAEAGGLQLGDRIVSVAGSGVSGAEEATERILAAGPDADVDLAVARGGGQQQLTVRLGRSPWVLPPHSPGRVYAALWAAAAAELARPSSDIPDWVLQLNMAAAQIHAGAWADAVNTLRRIEGAPTGPGLGEAAVQYWLGIALDRAGAAYVDAAREALAKAAAEPEARLYHNDGPRVAPRARARLAVLGSS